MSEDTHSEEAPLQKLHCGELIDLPLGGRIDVATPVASDACESLEVESSGTRSLLLPHISQCCAISEYFPVCPASMANLREETLAQTP